jgi:hypothetical protein
LVVVSSVVLGIQPIGADVGGERERERSSFTRRGEVAHASRQPLSVERWWWYVMVRYDVRRLVSVVASKAHPGFVQKMEQSASSVAVVVVWEGHALAIGNTAA